MNDTQQAVDARTARDGGGDQTFGARLPAGLVADLDALVESNRTDYEHRSEAIRDLLHRGLMAHPESSRTDDARAGGADDQ